MILFVVSRWINPSDCVDMDCDGRRQLLITDIDGSYTGNAGDTIVPKAEYEWGGDSRFGLGIKVTFLNFSLKQQQQ